MTASACGRISASTVSVSSIANAWIARANASMREGLAANRSSARAPVVLSRLSATYMRLIAPSSAVRRFAAQSRA
jgi:hypothetical protein